MKKVLIAMLVVWGMLIGMNVLTPSPAQAYTPNIVTINEFLEPYPGWSMARVHDVFDTDGTISWKDPQDDQGRWYNTAFEGTTVVAFYDWNGEKWKITHLYWCDGGGCSLQPNF